jgi:hypothetical protein
MPLRRVVFLAAIMGSMHVSPALLAQDLGNADSLQSPDSGRAPTPVGAAKRSLLWTVLPSATLILAPVALVGGPAAGYFYGGLPGRAWTGIGIRTVGLGAMIGAFGVCGWDCSSADGAYNAAWALFIGGSAILLGSAVYDMATVSGAVRKRTRAEALVLPPSPSGSPARVGISVRF